MAKAKTAPIDSTLKDTTSDLTRLLLEHRGIKTPSEADIFLNPSYDNHTHSPFLLPDMEKAVSRILQALTKNEKTVIYADYDADGIPGAVVLHDALKALGFENFDVYIPHRYQEGFGLNKEAIKNFSSNKVDLIITVDCGARAVEEAKFAKEKGIDLIITDHHLPSDPEPSALAIVNPNSKESTYPFKDLSGAGVAFKLACALFEKVRQEEYDNLNIVPVGYEKWLLDMVGVATLSDMVPLLGENRVLAHFGLKVIRKARRPGLKALLKKLRMDRETITEDDVVFMITPRINAASRMGVPSDAFRLLSARSAQEAEKLADHLDSINNERKGAVAAMVKEANRRLAKVNSLEDVVVIGDPRWKPGLVGLVAQKLVEKYEKTFFVWGREGSEIIRGSCRSCGSLDVVSLMESASESFLEYGGHKFSGGFSVDHEKVHSLSEDLLSVSENAFVSGVEEGKEKNIVEHSLDEADETCWRDIERFAPFGKANSKPIFKFEEAHVGAIKHFGKDKNHLEIMFVSPQGKKVKAISFFNTADDFESLEEGKSVTLLATMEKSFFGRRPEVRLRVVDISR